MALSTLILKDEAYIKLAGLQINLTENASASDILNALGISKALFFKGITSTTLADNATTSPIVISGANYTPEAGAVVIYDDSEFLWTGSKWERLGRDSSFKLTQSPVSSPSASGAALAFIDTISQNENGNITVTKKNLDTVPVAQGGSGKTTAVDAANVFLSALPAWTANPTDTTYFIRQDTGGSNSFGRVKAETIYNYIAGKASGTWSISVAGNAATATKLATARSLKTKLDSTTAVTFDGSADQDAIPVTGTLPIANGGTGGTTAETARLNLGIGNSRVFYGICTTAAGTAAKVVTCAEYDQLKAGDMVVVKFDATNTAAVGSLTLSVNGSTAKNIKRLYNTTGASNLTAAGELNKDGIAVFVYNGTYWLLTNADYNNTYYYTSIYCTTAAATAAKVAAVSGAQELTAGKYFQVWMLYSNTAQSALTLNISSQGAKPIYINGTASSSTNYTLPRGCYIVYYDGTNYHFRTDNKLPGSIGGNADTADTWTTGRTLTIGGTGKTVNGSADVSWSLTEIGASVSNTLTDGTSSAAPKISTTVNGVTGNTITLTTASTSKYGATKLTDTFTSTDSTLATTGKAVNSAITSAIGGLDVASAGGGTGEYISAISETDGKISATVSTTSVANTLTAGTGDNAPKISTTVNGVTGNTIELTKASTSVYGAAKLTDTFTSNNSTLATTGKAVNSAVTSAINALDVSSVGGGTGEYISAISETDGKISATKATTSVANTVAEGANANSAPTISTTVNGVTGNSAAMIIATTGKYGVTKLTDSITSTDSTLAVTGKAVSTAISSAINGLDVTSVGGGTGEYISAISQTDGKISATKATTSVGNTLTAGTSSAAPKFTTTVNGVTGNEITLTTAATDKYGVTKLLDAPGSGGSYSDTDNTLAATPKYVYSRITSAINGLDVASAGGGTGEYVSAISETDGKISATITTTSVGNTLTAGTSSAAPKISTTVNGITGNDITLTTASTSVYGVTKLTDTVTSTNSSLAVTGKAVNGAITTAIQALDVASVGGGTGEYISAITETDGKISATKATTSVGNTVTAGTGDNAPKISTTVNGITGNSVELTKASTSVYGATKLTDTYSSTNTTLAVTGAAIASAVGAYLPLAGGTMTGILTLKGNQYADSYSGALNANNSNIYGLNSIYTADASDNAAEGIHFYRSATNVDTLWISGGNIYFVPNRALGTSTTAANSQKVLRGPATITDGYLFAADSTSGLTKQIQATNANTASTIVQRDANGNFSAGTITATSFNGNVPEANLVWGGKNFSASYGCIDAAMIEPLGANRFAFLKAAGLTIEYSTNGGSTWTDYGATDVQKTGLFGAGQSFVLGKHTTAGTNTVNDQLRVTIATSAAGLYTVLNKIAIYMSTSGNTVQVKMERALESTPTTFSTHLDWTGISGWSGWNILNISGITTYGNTAASQYGRIRFTFRQTAVNTNYASASISRIMGFGGMGWTVPSNMARDGHLYSYDNAQNATFPATVTAPTFDGFATKIRVNPSTTPTAVGSIWVTT